MAESHVGARACNCPLLADGSGGQRHNASCLFAPAMTTPDAIAAVRARLNSRYQIIGLDSGVKPLNNSERAFIAIGDVATLLAALDAGQQGTHSWRSCGHIAWGTCSTCYVARGQELSAAQAERDAVTTKLAAAEAALAAVGEMIREVIDDPALLGLHTDEPECLCCTVRVKLLHAVTKPTHPGAP